VGFGTGAEWGFWKGHGPEHRIELEPRGAIRVRFASVEWNEIPAPGRDYGDGGFRFELLSC
jgi:hypothetical protein